VAIDHGGVKSLEKARKSGLKRGASLCKKRAGGGLRPPHVGGQSGLSSMIRKKHALGLDLRVETAFPRDKRKAFARRSRRTKRWKNDAISFNRIMI
jgi:hypothetical protein